MFFSCEIRLRGVQNTLKLQAVSMDYATEYHLQGQNN